MGHSFGTTFHVLRQGSPSIRAPWLGSKAAAALATTFDDHQLASVNSIMKGPFMTRSTPSSLLQAPVLALAIMFAPVGSSIAADPPVVIEWAPGEACPDFGLRVELYVDTAHLTFRQFVDKNGNPLRLLLAGQNFALTFTNMTTGASFHSRAEGAVQHWTLNADGSTTLVATGHTGVTWFSTDVPPGPATAWYVGRLVVDIDTSGVVWTLRKVTGQVTDICAAVS